MKKLTGMVTYLEAEIDRVSKEEANLKIYNHVGICFRSVTRGCCEKEDGGRSHRGISKKEANLINSSYHVTMSNPKP